jgi:hypothetical protein
MRQVVYVRKNNNIIEINGQRYDATTGAVLTHSSSNNTKTHPVLIDGADVQVTKPAARAVTRQPVKHLPPHKPTPSRALMRQAVKKPGPSSKRRFKAQAHVDAPAKQPLSSVLINDSAKRLDEERLKHAIQVTKSHLVSHFSPPSITNTGHSPATESSKPNTAASPIRTASNGRPALAKARQATSPGQRPKSTAELLERAVQQATSYQDLPPARTNHSRAKRNAGIGATVVLSVLLLSVVVTQNLSNVRLQMASAKAGFSASLPDYRPAGYSLGQLDYSDGVVAAGFHSNSDDRRYTITQKRSSWDSTTLRDSFVAPADAHYQTVEAAGRTIYLYGEHNATWLNGGIWYVIQANGSLSDHQLIELATSL